MHTIHLLLSTCAHIEVCLFFVRYVVCNMDRVRSFSKNFDGDMYVLLPQVNEFQGRIRDTTKRMMATVSELSMHQATALKLQQEKMARERELQEAK